MLQHINEELDHHVEIIVLLVSCLKGSQSHARDYDNKKVCMYVYIYIYTYLYLYISLSESWARLAASSQAGAGSSSRAALKWYYIISDGIIYHNI